MIIQGILADVKVVHPGSKVAGFEIRVEPLGFLGIDLGMRIRTSWALVDRAGELVAVGDVPVDPSLKNGRYGQLAIDLYHDLPWDMAEKVGVEQPWMGPNKHTMRVIAMGTGVVAAVVGLFGKELVVVEPKRAKHALTGNHLASARSMVKEAQQRWPHIEISNVDQASAIGVALAVWERG